MKEEIQACNTDTCSVPAKSETESSKTWVRPYYESERNDEAFRLKVYVPGSNKSGVKLSVNEGVINLTAERSDAPSENWKPITRELKRADYKLDVRIPEKVDVESISATVENGILSLVLPIREAAKPRVIEVE